MGAGIAQVALEAGHEVVLHDVDPAAIERGRGRIRAGLERRARRLDLDPDAADGVGRRPTRRGCARPPRSTSWPTPTPGLVIEAALEDLGREAGDPARARCGDAARRPSSRPTRAPCRSTAIASATAQPAARPRAPLLQPGPGHAARRGGRRAGDRPGRRRARDRARWSPGARRPSAARTRRASSSTGSTGRSRSRRSRCSRPATAASSRSTRRCARPAIPMGPFELMDLVGIDINLAAATRHLRERPRPATRCRAVPPVADPGAPRRGRPARPEDRRGLLPLRADGRRSAGGRLTSRPASRPTASRLAPPDRLAPATAIAERITLAIVNEAYRALGEGVATVADIDLALRLGAGHPVGPFERATRSAERRASSRRLRRPCNRRPPLRTSTGRSRRGMVRRSGGRIRDSQATPAVAVHLSLPSVGRHRRRARCGVLGHASGRSTGADRHGIECRHQRSVEPARDAEPIDRGSDDDGGPPSPTPTLARQRRSRAPYDPEMEAMLPRSRPRIESTRYSSPMASFATGGDMLHPALPDEPSRCREAVGPARSADGRDRASRGRRLGLRRGERRDRVPTAVTTAIADQRSGSRHGRHTTRPSASRRGRADTSASARGTRSWSTWPVVLRGSPGTTLVEHGDWSCSSSGTRPHDRGRARSRWVDPPCRAALP